MREVLIADAEGTAAAVVRRLGSDASTHMDLTGSNGEHPIRRSALLLACRMSSFTLGSNEPYSRGS